MLHFWANDDDGEWWRRRHTIVTTIIITNRLVRLRRRSSPGVVGTVETEVELALISIKTTQLIAIMGFISPARYPLVPPPRA